MTTYNNVLGVFSSAAHTLVNTLWSERALKKAGVQSMHTVLKLDWPCYKNARVATSKEKYKRESALKVARRNATKTPSKPLLKTSTWQLCLGNRLHRSECEA